MLQQKLKFDESQSGSSSEDEIEGSEESCESSEDDVGANESTAETSKSTKIDKADFLRNITS